MMQCDEVGNGLLFIGSPEAAFERYTCVLLSTTAGRGQMRGRAIDFRLSPILVDHADGIGVRDAGNAAAHRLLTGIFGQQIHLTSQFVLIHASLSRGRSATASTSPSTSTVASPSIPAAGLASIAITVAAATTGRSPSTCPASSVARGSATAALLHYKLQQAPTTHALLQVHKGIVATGPTAVGLQGLVAAHHVLPMPCDPLLKSRCLVDGQRQPITVQHFAHPIFRPHPQPKLAGFTGQVRVHDVGASGGLGRVLGQSIGEIDALKRVSTRGPKEPTLSIVDCSRRPVPWSPSN